MQESILKCLECLESLKEFRPNGKNDEETQKNGKKFENYVRDRLIKIGYSKFEIDEEDKVFKQMLADIRANFKNTNRIRNDYRDMQAKKILIQQPWGSQKTPDLLLLDITREWIHIQPIEVKSGKKSATWNNTYPVKHWIYIFNGTKGVTYFKGENLITQKVTELFEEYKTKRIELTKQYNEMLEKIGEAWKLVDYFKFEHTSGVDYRGDEEECSRRENAVKDMLLEFVSLSLNTRDGKDDDAESVASCESDEAESAPPSGVETVKITITSIEGHKSAVATTLRVTGASPDGHR